MAASRTDRIIDRFASKWRHKESPAKYRGDAKTADQAWALFQRLAHDVFGDDVAQPQSIKQKNGRWEIRAHGSNGSYIGYVSTDGRVTYIELENR